MHRLVPFAGLLLVISATPLFAQGTPRPVTDAIAEFVEAERVRQKIPGVAIGIRRGDETFMARGFGLANVEHDVPVKPETIFQSGSVGKQFTAAAVMTAVEDGKMALDDPITKWLEDAPETWKEITVRHLLTHTSGVPNYTNAEFDYRKDREDDELVRLSYPLPFDFKPGTKWSYSNTGYVILGLLVRKATGRHYGEVLAERVFTPLGMKTARIISESEIVPNRAAGYQRAGDKLRNQEWVAPRLNTTADGSLYLSILDMLAWDRGIREKKILSAESWEKTFTPVVLASGNPFPYGFGWGIDDAPRRHEHTGAWQGFKSAITRYLDHDLTVIVLANHAQANPGAFIEGIAKILAPDIAEAESRPNVEDDPALRERATALIAALAKKRETAVTFADDAPTVIDDVTFAPELASFLRVRFRNAHAKLEDLGAPASMTLLRSKRMGDARACRFEVRFEKSTLYLSLQIDDTNAIIDFRI